MIPSAIVGYRLLKVAALVLGSGELAMSAADPVRLTAKLASCTATYRVVPSGGKAGPTRTVKWDGCQELAQSLLSGGGLLLLGAGMPASARVEPCLLKKPEDQDKGPDMP